MPQHVFGPVPSRRLGFSLGVDIIPRKHCTFDCVYCQVGETTDKEIIRRPFYSPDDVVKEIVEKAKKASPLDVISISGSGEPTLNSDLGFIITQIKRRTTVPVVVITNGSLLDREDVRVDLLPADMVLPSLDAVRPDEFERINRPHPSITVESIIRGLKEFRREYRGEIWLEIMLAANYNIDADHIEMLRKIVRKLGAEKVHLNTVVRPPLEPLAGRVDDDTLLRIAPLFGRNCEIISDFARRDTAVLGDDDWAKSVKEMVKRRSLNLKDVAKTTGITQGEAEKRLKELVERKEIDEVVFNGQVFYTAPSSLDRISTKL